MTRRASPAMRSTAPRIAWRAASSSGIEPPDRAMFALIASTRSGAPLTKIVRLPELEWSVAIHCRSLWNGISLRRGQASSSCSLRRPAFAAATTSAPSVGSPRMLLAGGAPVSKASLQSAPARSRHSSVASSCTETAWPSARISPTGS